MSESIAQQTLLQHVAFPFDSEVVAQRDALLAQIAFRANDDTTNTPAAASASRTGMRVAGVLARHDLLVLMYDLLNLPLLRSAHGRIPHAASQHVDNDLNDTWAHVLERLEPFAERRASAWRQESNSSVSQEVQQRLYTLSYCAVSETRKAADQSVRHVPDRSDVAHDARCCVRLLQHTTFGLAHAAIKFALENLTPLFQWCLKSSTDSVLDTGPAETVDVQDRVSLLCFSGTMLCCHALELICTEMHLLDVFVSFVVWLFKEQGLSLQLARDPPQSAEHADRAQSQTIAGRAIAELSAALFRHADVLLALGHHADLLGSGLELELAIATSEISPLRDLQVLAAAARNQQGAVVSADSTAGAVKQSGQRAAAVRRLALRVHPNTAVPAHAAFGLNF